MISAITISSLLSLASASTEPSGASTCEPPVHGQSSPLVLGLPTVLDDTCHSPFSMARHGMCMRFSSGPRELSELSSTCAPSIAKQRAVSGRMPSAQMIGASLPSGVSKTR